VIPTNATGSSAGTLEASLVDHWSYVTTHGITSGTLATAEFLEASGTLDFYYQITNDPQSATSIARLSNLGPTDAGRIAPGQTSLVFRY
jgi:hypothetical protein